jgi:hypothetical protein
VAIAWVVPFARPNSRCRPWRRRTRRRPGRSARTSSPCRCCACRPSSASASPSAATSRKLGISSAAMMPMIATTISSSISVKPRCRFRSRCSMIRVSSPVGPPPGGFRRVRRREQRGAMPSAIPTVLCFQCRWNGKAFDKSLAPALTLRSVSHQAPHHLAVDSDAGREARQLRCARWRGDLQGVGAEDEEGREAVGRDPGGRKKRASVAVHGRK